MRIPWVSLVVIMLALVGTNGRAQEVGFIDLTKVTARTELRRPPSPQEDAGPRGGIEEVHRCFGSTKTVAALRADLLSLDRTHYQIGDEPILEVTVENAGSTPMEIPFSPHFADFQSKDPAEKFAYTELRIVLWIASAGAWGADTGGIVTLYGANDHKGTMLTLNPGESVRIIGKGKFLSPSDGSKDQIFRSHPADRAYAQAELYHSQHLVTSRQRAITRQEVCLAHPDGQSVAIQMMIP